MKINMWKLLLAALIASAALVGCKDERNNFMVDDTVAFLKDKTFMKVSMFNEQCDFPVIKAGKGLSGATVRLEASAEALAAYNAANGTNYIAIPESAIEYTKALKYSEQDNRQTVNVTWVDTDIKNLGEGNYAVAFKLSVDNGALKIPEDRQVMVVSIEGSEIGMDLELAPVFSPAASREAAVYAGPVSIDNPILVKDITVNYEIDNSLVADYNAANGTDYKTLSAELVSLAAPSSVLEAGKSATAFSLQILSDKLFNGNELKAVDNNKYLVPVCIKSFSNEAVGKGRYVTYVPVSFNEGLKGPWTILEGEGICAANDPNRPGAQYDKYTSSKIFDGVFGDIGSWLSPFWTPMITFPMVFVVDMGKTHVFTKFIIYDYVTHQSQYKDFEFSVADEYNGASTKWTLVASGTREGVEIDNPNNNNNTKTEDPHDFQVQKMVAGRYLKFVIVKPTWTEGQYVYGRGKLADVQGMGF